MCKSLENDFTNESAFRGPEEPTESRQNDVQSL